MDVYKYNGPVLYYKKVIANNWKGETKANSRAKAISNLKCQFKISANMMYNSGGIELIPSSLITPQKGDIK